MDGIPFIGENKYYPRWARGSGRWLFQRTVVVVGRMLGMVQQLHADEVPVARQIVVWVPPTRLPILGMLPSAVHRERQRALAELGRLKLVCYGDGCSAPMPGSDSLGIASSSVIREYGLYPDEWLLLCPSCGASVGPDIANMSAEPLIRHWYTVGKPRLENPFAGALMKSADPIVDLPQWIERLQPSHLELAYLGQQMWTDIEGMLAAMTESARSPK